MSRGKALGVVLSLSFTLFLPYLLSCHHAPSFAQGSVIFITYSRPVAYPHYFCPAKVTADGTRCGHPISPSISQTEANPGRSFYSCVGIYAHVHPKYFRWADTLGIAPLLWDDLCGNPSSAFAWGSLCSLSVPGVPFPTASTTSSATLSGPSATQQAPPPPGSTPQSSKGTQPHKCSHPGCTNPRNVSGKCAHGKCAEHCCEDFWDCKQHPLKEGQTRHSTESSAAPSTSSDGLSAPLASQPMSASTSASSLSFAGSSSTLLTTPVELSTSTSSTSSSGDDFGTINCQFNSQLREIWSETTAAELEMAEANRLNKVKEGIRIEKIKPPTPSDEDAGADEEEDYEEEEEEVKHKIISKEVLLGAVQLTPKVPDGNKTVVRVQFIVGIEGNVDVEVSEVVPEGKEGEVVRLHVPGLEA
ncbi:hypothetical protein NMY22_g18150 [Coprinellus aureogranulatus]|nr:hypothetical protein NMY22_g18150 [Coprinellus aureogranulatus]